MRNVFSASMRIKHWLLTLPDEERRAAQARINFRSSVFGLGTGLCGPMFLLSLCFLSGLIGGRTDSFEMKCVGGLLFAAALLLQALMFRYALRTIAYFEAEMAGSPWQNFGAREEFRDRPGEHDHGAGR